MSKSKPSRVPARKSKGRPSKLTKEVEEKILSAIRAGNYARVAAEYAGIGERTFYRWLQQGQEAGKGRFWQFWQAVKKAEREAEVRAVAIIQKHMEGNWTAAMTYLERKYPQRWGRRDRLTVEVNPREALARLLDLEPEELDEAVETAVENE